MKSSISRRRFFKASSMVTGALISLPSVLSCSEATRDKCEQDELFPVFHGKGYVVSDGIAGLLYSQIGYEQGKPVRIIVRLPKENLLNREAICRLLPVKPGKDYQAPLVYWGEIWKSHWWVAGFNGIEDPGEWNIEIYNDKISVLRAKGLIVARDILWDKTIELAALDMLERRVHFTKVGAGWQDAGTLWVESCSQSAMIIALTELIERCDERLGKEFKERIYRQITVGCDYLVMTQNKAKELGFPAGAMCHDLHGHEKDILPHDAAKAVVALSRAARYLPDSFRKKKEAYQSAADLAFSWLHNKARPMGSYGLSLFQRGLPQETIIPPDEWQTRQLVTHCWAALELFRNGQEDKKATAVEFARQIMAMQIKQDQAECGFYGHFREYKSLAHSEKSWIHGIINNNEFGADMGGFYPNYLVPLVTLIKMWPDHEDAPKWKDTLHDFAFGYLIPACEMNPFYIVPQGIFGKEGPVWFCGTFHGTNAIYGFTAALALELAELFDEKKLTEIAYGNLQWLAGLNGGITTDNLRACMVYSTDIPEGIALPASMLCGVGRHWAGSWFATRGVICNGFSTGKQFVYDTEPVKDNDGPFSLTDEDWIPHTAGWLTGLMRLA